MSVTLPALQGRIWAPDQALPLLPAGNCPVPAQGERARPVRMT